MVGMAGHVVHGGGTDVWAQITVLAACVNVFHSILYIFRVSEAKNDM